MNIYTPLLTLFLALSCGVFACSTPSSGSPPAPQHLSLTYEQGCSQDKGSDCLGVARYHEAGEAGYQKSMEKAGAFYQKACDLGETEGCVKFARMLEFGNGMEEDIERAVKYYKIACDAKNFEGCTELALYMRDGGGSFTKNVEKGTRLLEAYCLKEEEGLACYQLGLMYLSGEKVLKDKSKAGQYFRSGCELNHMRACYQAGEWAASDDEGNQPDHKQANRFYEKACIQGDVLAACITLGFNYENARGFGSQDQQKALFLYKKACESEKPVPAGCFNLASAYMSGKGVKKNLVRAQQLFEKACLGGVKVSCVMWGELELSERSSFNQGVARLEKLCDDQVARACVRLGEWLYKTASKPQQNHKHALVMYERGCALQSPYSCVQAGYLHENALGTTRSFSRALTYYTMGCDMDLGWSCFEAAKLYGSSSAKVQATIKTDLLKARVLYKKSCTFKDGRGCFRLGEILNQSAGSRDKVEALNMHERGCDLKHIGACDALRRKLLQKKDPTRYARVLKSWSNRCRLGESQLCFRAVLLLDPWDNSKTLDASLELLNRGCDIKNLNRSDHRACRSLVHFLVQGGKGIQPEPELAIKIQRNMCRVHKDPLFCHTLAFHYEHGQFVPKDHVRMLELHELSCTYGLPMGCIYMARFYRTGKHVKKDGEKSVKYAQKVCELRGVSPCHELAENYREGVGVPKDEVKALELYREGCEHHSAGACWSLGDAYESGKLGLSRDEARAYQSYDAACKSNHQTCWIVAKWNYEGRHVQKDLKKAMKLYQKSCGYGSGYACRRTGQMFRKGEGVAQSEESAKKYFTVGCRLYDQESCKML